VSLWCALYVVSKPSVLYVFRPVSIRALLPAKQTHIMSNPAVLLALRLGTHCCGLIEKGHPWRAQHTCAHVKSKSSLTLFVTCAEYNKCKPYHKPYLLKPLTNSDVQEELRKYLPNKLK
jgi:hypothetical protein